MKQYLILIFLTLIVSCHKNQSNSKIVHFINDSSISTIDGNPIDSLSLFFPKKLFNDTTKYLIYGKDTIELKSLQNIDALIKYKGLIKNKAHFLDSIRIDNISYFSAKVWSFALFKMKEPILCNYNLNKEIYRVLIDRPFSKFLIINIEKNNDSFLIITKRLNRQVGYPFIVYKEVLFIPPDNKETPPEEIDRIHYHNDSMAKKYNNTDYFIDTLICKRISEQQWTELQNKLENVKFWNSYPKACRGCMQIDGSRWVIEGHNKNGYQIHVVLSPFDKYYYKNVYADLFKFIVNISGIKTDRFRFY